MKYASSESISDDAYAYFPFCHLRSPNLFQCRINPAEFAICLIHRRCIFGLDGLGDLDRGGTRSFYAWPRVDADAGQQRSAERAALFGCQQLTGRP